MENWTALQWEDATGGHLLTLHYDLDTNDNMRSVVRLSLKVQDV